MIKMFLVCNSVLKRAMLPLNPKGCDVGGCTGLEQNNLHFRMICIIPGNGMRRPTSMMNGVSKRSVLMLTVTAYATFQVTPTTDVVLSPGHLTKPRV